MDPEPTTDRSERGVSPLTIKEIARLTGVSIGTVDRVLHNRGRVSAENMAKIQALVAERDYRPNVFASRLSGGSLKTVGVVMPGPDEDFGYWGLIRNGMDRAARELEPLQVEVRVETFRRQESDDCARAFHAALAGFPGALALAPIHAGVLRSLVEALPGGLPVLFFDADMRCTRDHAFVGQDPRQGGLLAARLLDLSLPPGAVVALVRFEGDDEHLLARAEGFGEGAGKAGHPVVTLVQDLGAPLGRRLDEVERFLASHPEAGGLFVPNASAGEYSAVGTRRRTVGYDLVPRNQEALGAGRLDFVLSQRPEFMGYEAVRRLSRTLLFGEALPSRVALPLDVIVQENLNGHLERPNS